MVSEEIVLYDIPSRDPCRAWSLNTWKVRLILNYKGVPYRTRWLEYPEIKPTLQLHFPDASIKAFTVPTIALPQDGKHIMDSKEIAKVLERLYPDPPLLLATPLSSRITKLQVKIWDAIEPIVLTHVHKRLLSEVNWPFWRESREPWLNGGSDGPDEADGEKKWMTLEDVEAELYADDSRLMDEAWRKAAPFVNELGEMLLHLGEDGTGAGGGGGGPFFTAGDDGGAVSFSDFEWIGFLVFIGRIGEDQWAKMKEACCSAVEGGEGAGEGLFAAHERLLDVAMERGWLRRDDH